MLRVRCDLAGIVCELTLRITVRGQNWQLCAAGVRKEYRDLKMWFGASGNWWGGNDPEPAPTTQIRS
jgi:hypothetical protein